ncbi:hypothetical protein FE810_11365 [Thalassotalea litorea]|uniref:DUF4382 domain-containing protein n=1 Tax=Thalassotalea litorea TaxID=2020715 RepID=A0A5R9IGM8_9GAMM|nr:hypothetical protein [Thalassotalea litorea]TLU64675.1 hypothetical protein FE810_11365 [Thalassotalea litorea]
MDYFRRLILIALAILTASCASNVTSIKEDIDNKLEVDEGYLLIAVDTSISLNKIWISGEKDIWLTADDLRSGTNYILINLPEGEYQIHKIKLNNWFSIVGFEDDLWNFKVEKGVISYVGHLDVQTSGWWSRRHRVELMNKSSLALEFLQDDFSTILANRKLTYHGPGEDEFFDIVLNNNEKGDL